MFSFKLQSILDVRKTQEEKTLQEFAEKQKELHKEQERLDSILKQKQSLIDKLRNMQGKPINVSEIMMDSDGVKNCQKHESSQKAQVREAIKKVEEKKTALFEAIKKRKTMESLKTKQAELYESAGNLLERTSMDEMAIVRHNRKTQT